MKSQNEIKRIVQKYLNNLHRNNIDVNAAYIFGSYVHGKPHSDSDIDIALVIGNMENSFDEQVKLLNFRRGISLDIEPHPLSPSDMEDEWNPLVREIKEHGIRIA